MNYKNLIRGGYTNERCLLEDFTVDDSNNGNLYLDGAACSGKSTMIQKLMKSYSAGTFKVNNILDTDDYNYNSNTAFHYMSLQMYMMKHMKNCVIDRSPISNLAFQYVYWLMENMTDALTPYQWCENYTKIHNMTALLEFIKSKKLNIVVIINTDYAKVSANMIARGTPSDRYKGRLPMYLKCQVYAYLYLAKKLNLPVLNHVDFEGNSYDEIYDIIQEHFEQHQKPGISVCEYDSNWMREKTSDFGDRTIAMEISNR